MVVINEPIVYIYSLSNPFDNTVKYIGKTKNPKRRLSEHLTKKGLTCKKGKWIRLLLSQGIVPIMEILDEVHSTEINFYEQYWISQYRAWGFILLNTQNGGDMAPYHFSSKYQKSLKKRIENYLGPKILIQSKLYIE